ncbi:hypothetical protein MKY09_11555 [Psychrobacillus sp. FSL K6-4046]|uniref:hypothetical protein n=1 Tax=Psychrobacillus sp. FSL K6-4046 TaxID=2921550 RepID=UPI0031599728
MGTLFEQIPRHDRLDKSRIVTIGKEVKEIGEELGISFDNALNLYLAVAKISDYDTKDEQLAGFGELLQNLINQLAERD